MRLERIAQGMYPHLSPIGEGNRARWPPEVDLHGGVHGREGAHAMYRCSICAMARITAFHSKFKCPKVRNPNKIQEELKVILIDEEGYELEEDRSGND